MEPPPPPDLGHFVLGPASPSPPNLNEFRQTSAALKYSGIIFALLGLCLIIRSLEVRRNRILSEMHTAQANMVEPLEEAQDDIE